MNQRVKELLDRPDYIFRIHEAAVIAVLAIMGILNLVSGEAVRGIILIAATVLVPLILAAARHTSLEARQNSLIIFQFIMIYMMGFTGHNFDTLFSIICATIMISIIYLNKKMVLINWITCDIVLLLPALFFYDAVYGGISKDVTFKGIVGINICALFSILLVELNLKSIKNAETKAAEAEKLVQEIEGHVNAAQSLTEKQSHIVDNVQTVSQKVNDSSEQLLNVAEKLSASSQEEAAVIQSFSAKIESMSQKIKLSQQLSSNACNAVEDSAENLRLNNEKMQEMLIAINEISESSKQIENIIKTIEDIAFQTNILALNASVEAARAGDAGKGFAVVADEVRNLASKCSEAANDTSHLINNSIALVERGTAIANETASIMNTVLESAEKTSGEFQNMLELAVEQTGDINSINTQVRQISDAVSINAATAEESSAIAHDVAYQVHRIREIIKQ